MKTLVISKPIYDYILPLVEFPEDGDTFFIENSIKTLSNVGVLTAITLAKYGLDVSFTGMIGDDEIGRKIKEIFESYRINTKYIETSYTERTCSNYKIYNSKTNKFTTIQEKSIKATLTKYKYEFIPDVIIMDDGDYGANLAAINNYPNSKLIYIGNKFTKDSLVYCNKCNYIISTLSFASEATGVTTNLNKEKNIVQLFQKFVDLYNANLIIKLNNFDILYCINDEVRLMKNINKNITNKENLYDACLSYFIITTNNVENSIKLTNKVMLESGNEFDMIKNIPDYKVIADNINNTKTNNQIVEEPKQNTQIINPTNKNIEIPNQTEIIATPKLDNTVIKECNGVNEIEKL